MWSEDGRPKSRSDSLRCSFCQRSRESGAKLISSPSDYPRAYICDQCVAVCRAILEDHPTDFPPVSAMPTNAEAEEPILANELTSSLLSAIVRWMRCESPSSRDAAEALSEVRRIAADMMSKESEG
jgi:hypothetical protein